MSDEAGDDRGTKLAGLYDRLGSSLFRYAVMILADPAEAEDVIQRVFLALAGLLLLCLAGTLLNPDFATWDNGMNVLTRTAFIGIIAVGMCFVIISGGIDLSVGSMAALIAGSVILFMNAMRGT